MVSGGFNAERIRAFEDAGAPVDAYGVGSAMRRGENEYTADVVKLEGVTDFTKYAVDPTAKLFPDFFC